MKTLKDMYPSLKDFGWSVLYSFSAGFGLALIAWYNANPGVDVLDFVKSGAFVGVLIVCLRSGLKTTLEYIIPNIKYGLAKFKEFVDKQKNNTP